MGSPDREKYTALKVDGPTKMMGPEIEILGKI